MDYRNTPQYLKLDNEFGLSTGGPVVLAVLKAWEALGYIDCLPVLEDEEDHYADGVYNLMRARILRDIMAGTWVHEADASWVLFELAETLYLKGGTNAAA